MGVFNDTSFLGHEQVVFCHDPATGLKAIVAIHDTTLGPALGGCRIWDYRSEEEALTDVLRLSRGMTYKASVAGLNLGGGKAVIIGDAKKIKTEALFRAFGRFIDGLGGRYITAEDVNMTVADIEHIGAETRYVSGLTRGSGDPSPMTALGVFVGIKASVKQRLQKDQLRGLKVAIQGVGHVGTYLCEYLHAEGVKLFVSDIDQEKVKQVCQKYEATAVNNAEIHTLDVDAYAPCALGAVLNDQTIPQLKTKVIAGAANNQLQTEAKHGGMLKERGILYAPDYVINAGGLINVYHEIRGYNEQAARTQTQNIYHTLLKIYDQSDKENIPTHKASDRLAEKRIADLATTKALRNGLDTQSWVSK